MDTTATHNPLNIQAVPVSGSAEAAIALRTYYVYIQAFSLLASAQIGNEQQQLSSFQRLQRLSTHPPESVQKLLFRGWLTLRAMQLLPIHQHPTLATTANFWAPVQAYYAIHGVGSAVLACLGNSIPEDHRAFRASMSGDQGVQRLLPYPFNMWCKGLSLGDHECPYQFGNCRTAVREAKQASNLQTPNRLTAHTLAAKALLTTRNKFLEDLFEKQRSTKVTRGKIRRNIMSEEKRRTEKKLHPTSIFDFLYRIRVRSNYDDPEMYIYGHTDTTTAGRHYTHLLHLTTALIECLERIIAQKCGSTLLGQWKQRFTM